MASSWPSKDQESETLSFASPNRVAWSRLRLIDSCITQLKAQGPARTCNESKEEKKGSGFPIPVKLPDGKQLAVRGPGERGGFRCYLVLRHLPPYFVFKNYFTELCSGSEAQLLYRNVQWFRGGLVFKAHRLVMASSWPSEVQEREVAFAAILCFDTCRRVSCLRLIDMWKFQNAALQKFAVVPRRARI